MNEWKPILYLYVTKCAYFVYCMEQRWCVTTSLLLLAFNSNKRWWQRQRQPFNSIHIHMFKRNLLKIWLPFSFYLFGFLSHYVHTQRRKHTMCNTIVSIATRPHSVRLPFSPNVVIVVVVVQRSWVKIHFVIILLCGFQGGCGATTVFSLHQEPLTGVVCVCWGANCTTFAYRM